MRRSYKDEAIVLKRTNYSEADRFIVIYSKYFGKKRILAKGIRKPKSRKRGALEVFSRIKYSAAKGKVYDIMTEVEALDLYLGIRKDLNKASLAYYYAEVIDKITTEDEQNDNLYKIVIEKFENLINSKNLKKERYNFINEILVNLGFWPKDKKMENHDYVLESVIERQVSSRKIGKRILAK